MSIQNPFFIYLIKSSTISLTETTDSNSGPKFQAPENFTPFSHICEPSHRYELRGSRTCCHGLVACGLRTFIGSLFLIDLMQSGTILSFAQSPPPTTFPARTEETDLP